MTTPELDLLAVGPHPDDVELFCGGTVITMVQRGHRVGVLDLSEGELSTHGTVPVRRAEAAAAAQCMGVAFRENLGLPDGGIHPATDPDQVREVVAALRRLRPRVLMIPWIEDRHPDHVATAHLMRHAVFAAGLVKYEAVGGAFRVQQVLYYQMRHRIRPSFIVDTSQAAATKSIAIQCHQSQIGTHRLGTETLVGSANAVSAIEARDQYYGSMIGVSHGEPLFCENTLGLVDPLQHFRDNPFTQAHAYEGSA